MPDGSVSAPVDSLWETTTRRRKPYGEFTVCLRIGDDAAPRATLFFSVEDSKRYYKSGVARLIELAKTRGKMVWYHCCGAMSQFMSDLIDIGMSVLEPGQVRLPRVAPERLHRDFGAKIVFYGAIKTQNTLPFGSEENVRREVRETARVLGADGGYIVGPDHSVDKDMPPKDVVALYNEAAKW